MRQEKLARRVLLATFTGKCPKGWSRTRWPDCLRPGLVAHCLVPEELQESAENRDVFRDLPGLPVPLPY